MSAGDLVKITTFGRMTLAKPSKHIGIVVDTLSGGSCGDVIYVSWPDRNAPSPISIKWLEKVK